MDVHVWPYSSAPNPAAKFPDKTITAAHTIAAALAVAAPGDVIVVWGDTPLGNARVTYVENLIIPVGGLVVSGRFYPIVQGAPAVGPVISLPSGARAATVIEGLEIERGASKGHGGGITATDTPLIALDCCIHDNTADTFGGGIGIQFTSEASYATCYVDNCWVYKNSSNDGGGIGLVGVSVPNSTSLVGPVVSVSSSRLGPANRATASGPTGGGRAYLRGAGLSSYRLGVVIDGCEIDHNQLTAGTAEGYGGGVCIFNIDENSLAEQVASVATIILSARGKTQGWIQGSIVHDNSATGGRPKGGGVAAVGGAVLSLESTDVLANQADGSGGGGYATTNSVLSLEGGTRWVGNRCGGLGSVAPGDGNGGAIHASCRGRVVVSSDNAFVSNNAEKHGGAISIRNAELEIDVLGGLTAFQNNVAGMDGGAIALLSEVPGSTFWERKLYLPCWIEVSVDVRGALFQENAAGRAGGGVSLVRPLRSSTFYNLGEHVRVTSCLFVSNQSASGADAVWVNRFGPLNAGAAPLSFDECTFRGHTSAAVVVDDQAGNAVWNGKTVLSRDVYEANGTGVRWIAGDGDLQGAAFRGNGTNDIVLAGENVPSDLTAMYLNGARPAAPNCSVGVHDTYPGWRWLGARPSVEKSDVLNHALYGALEAGGSSIGMSGCYYGNVGGPTLPGGPPLGDAVSGNVRVSGVSAAPVVATPPAATALAPPALPPQTPPVVPTCDWSGERDDERRPPREQDGAVRRCGCADILYWDGDGRLTVGGCPTPESPVPPAREFEVHRFRWVGRAKVKRPSDAPPGDATLAHLGGGPPPLAEGPPAAARVTVHDVEGVGRPSRAEWIPALRTTGRIAGWGCCTGPSRVMSQIEPGKWILWVGGWPLLFAEALGAHDQGNATLADLAIDVGEGLRWVSSDIPPACAKAWSIRLQLPNPARYKRSARGSLWAWPTSASATPAASGKGTRLPTVRGAVMLSDGDEVETTDHALAVPGWRGGIVRWVPGRRASG